MSGWLLNLLANTKFHVDRARVTFLFLSNLLLINIPLKNVQVKNISFQFDFIKRIIAFFSKKKKKKKKKKASPWGKKEIHVESLSCTLDWRDYEDYNSDYNIYARLLQQSLKQRIVQSVWVKLLLLFLNAIFKHYVLRVGKLCVKIRHRHAHTQGEHCRGDGGQTKGRATYHLTLCDVCLYLDHHGGTANGGAKQNEDGSGARENEDGGGARENEDGGGARENEDDHAARQNQHGSGTPTKRGDHLWGPPPSHLRCGEISLRRESERANTVLAKNIFFFVNERSVFVSLFYLNGQACELKEVFYRWTRRQRGDHYLKDLIKVLQRNSAHPHLWSFFQGNQASLAPRLAAPFDASFFSHFSFSLDTLLVKLHLGGDVEVRTRGRKLWFETPQGKKLSCETPPGRKLPCETLQGKKLSVETPPGRQPSRETPPWEAFSLSIKSLLTWSGKNAICINAKKAGKLLCEVPLEADLNKCNQHDVEAVRWKTLPLNGRRCRENILLREGPNRYRLRLDHSCVVIHLEELLTRQRRLTHLFGLGFRGGHVENSPGVSASSLEDPPHRGYFPTEAIRMSLFNLTIYVSNNLSKSLLLRCPPVGRRREEELPHGMSTQQGNEGALKVELHEMRNYEVRDDRQECTYRGRTLEGRPHFHLNGVILKWVYSQQGVLYEYAVSDPMDVTLKRGKRQKGADAAEGDAKQTREESSKGGELPPVTTAYVARSTWYLLPEHITFVQGLYTLYCQHGREKTSPLRSSLTRRSKRRREDAHSNSYTIVILKNCQVNLFCISRNFDVYWRVCRLIGHGDVKPLEGATEETPPLASITASCDFVGILNFASKGESLSKQGRFYCSRFYLSNVGLQVRELPNRLSRVLSFKRDRVDAHMVPSEKRRSEHARSFNSPYDVVIRVRDKNVHVDVRNVARVTFCSLVVYELYASLVRMVCGEASGEVSGETKATPPTISNGSLHSWMRKPRGRRSVYRIVRRGRSTAQVSESCPGEGSPKQCHFQEEGEPPTQPCCFLQNSMRKATQPLRNRRNLVKYRLLVDLKSQVAFVSTDQVRSLQELQKIKNEELKRSEQTLCLAGRLSLLYFDPLQRENIKRGNFMQVHFDANQVKVRKRTHSGRTFKLFHFEKRLSHEGSTPVPDVFSSSFYKIFRSGKGSHPRGRGAGRYLVVEATVRNVDEVARGAANTSVRGTTSEVVTDATDEVVGDAANHLMDGTLNPPPRAARLYNSETTVRGRGLRVLYKTNDFFFFLNKYLLTDVCCLFSARRALGEAAAEEALVKKAAVKNAAVKNAAVKKATMKEVALNPAEEHHHRESAYLHFRDAEVADPFALRSSIAQKRQLGSGIPKRKKPQIESTGENHHPGYKVRRSELKTLPVSLNKYQLVLDRVLLFLPSMTNNRNFLIAQNDVVIRNHIELKKKKKKKKIEILDKTYVHLLNTLVHSMDGMLVARNVNVMIMHSRSVLSRLLKPFTLSAYISGVVRVSPRSYKLLQDVLLENVLGNHFEHVQGGPHRGGHYSGRHYNGGNSPNGGASLNGGKPHGEAPSRHEVTTQRGRRVKDLDVRLHLLHILVELQNDRLHSRMSLLFGKFLFARTVRYLGEEQIVTYVKGAVPLVMNTFYEYPYDILMCHRKLNPRKYAKWLIRMNRSGEKHDEQSFNSLLKMKMRKYSRVKKRDRKTFHLVYKRARRDHLGCDVTNDVEIKIERICLHTDMLQLLNLYSFYFVDDRNVHLSRVEKLFRCQGRAKPFEGKQFAEEQPPLKGFTHTWLPPQASLQTLKLESIRNAPPEEPLDRRILTAYQRMVAKLTPSDFSNYDSVVRSNNVYAVRARIRHAHFSFNFLFYESVLGVRRLPLRGAIQKGTAKEAANQEPNGVTNAPNQPPPFGLTYRGSIDLHLSFNLRKSIFQKFAKKAKYIFFNNYVVDNFLQNRLNKSGELANFVLHTVDHIGDELEEHVYFKCNIKRKNYLYLINRGGSYCISRNISLCVSARNEKVIYFNGDEKKVKVEGLHYREVFLDSFLGSSPSGGVDEKLAKEKGIICDVQLVDHNGVDLRKGSSNGGASAKWEGEEDSLARGGDSHARGEVLIGEEPKGGEPQHQIRFSSPPPPSSRMNVGQNSIRVETPCTKPKYIDVQVKQANVVIKLADFLYLGSKLHELLYLMSRHEEVNVCLFRLSEASSKRKKRHTCKIKRMKMMSYSTFIVRVILSSLDLHLFESVYYAKLKKCKKSKISHVHVQANYEYLTCHRKDDTLFKRHQSDMSLQINFAKNNIYEEFTRGMRLKVICIKTGRQSNLIIILEKHGVNVFLTKNAFRSALRLYEEASDWRNYRAREVAHRGWSPEGAADQSAGAKRAGQHSANRSCEAHNEASREQSRRVQKARRNYEVSGTHNCGEASRTLNCVRRGSPKLRALLRSKHFIFPHDDHAVVNRTLERVATYRSGEISHAPFDRSNPVHMLYVRRMESFIFPSLTSKWSASGELVLSCEHSLYVVSSTVCIYNDTNHDVLLLINSYRIVLFAKRYTYLSRHRCNLQRDHFMLLLFYKKGLFISSRLSLHEFKRVTLGGREKMHQFLAHKKYLSCRLAPDRCEGSLLCGASFKVVPLGRVSGSGQIFCAHGGGSGSHGGGDSSKELSPESPLNLLTNQYSLYNRLHRKLAKALLNDERLSPNCSSSGDRIFTTLTAIRNEKTDDGALYLNIGQMAKVRNTLPIRVHYRSGDTACSVKAFSSKEIFSSDLDLNVSCNILRGTKLNITYDRRLGFSPLGDPSAPPTDSNPQNEEVKEEPTKGDVPPERSRKPMEGPNSGQQHHEEVTHHYVNVIKWNDEIVVTCHTLVCLYADEMKVVEVNRKRIHFAPSPGGGSVAADRGASKRGECGGATPPTLSLKRLNLYVGMYNEPVSSIHLESYQISSMPINSCKEATVPATHRGRECSSHYTVEYRKNCSLGSHSRYSRVSSLLMIYPRLVMLNQTDFNLTMFCSFGGDSMVYTFERKSRSVINLLESGKRSFFFQIGRAPPSIDYVFVSGGIDITKEGSYVLCFTNGRHASSSVGGLPQNGRTNHLHKSGRREKRAPQSVHLKISIVEGSKLNGESAPPWGHNCLFVTISKHKMKKKKVKKYLAMVNSPSVAMHSMESNEQENTLMHIYHFIKEEERVKKIYVYNDMGIDLIFDVFHFSEFVHMIRKVLGEESSSSARTSQQKGAEQNGREPNGAADRCTPQGRHNRAKESFFRNIFLLESSDNSSADEMTQTEQQTTYDAAKLTKQNIRYISSHVDQLKKFVKDNLRYLRRIGRKSLRLFPLRKNKNVKNAFLVVYPWRHARGYHIVKLSLKRKKHVLSFTRGERSGDRSGNRSGSQCVSPGEPPLVVILETFVLRRKGKTKILIKISQHVDNIVHIRGKVNMNTLFSPGGLTHSGGEVASTEEPPLAPNTREGVTKKGSDPHGRLANQQIDPLNRFATVVGPLTQQKRAMMPLLPSAKGAYPNGFHTEVTVTPMQRPRLVRRQTRRLQKRENNAALWVTKTGGGRSDPPPTYCHFKNKNVTLLESRSKYKVIITKRGKGAPEGGLHLYVGIEKSIRINVFSTMLVEGDAEGKLSLESPQKGQAKLAGTSNGESSHPMAHSPQRELFKKKKNAHLCTLMFRSTSLLVGLHKNQPNVVLLSLGDATIMEFASPDRKKVLCRYNVKGGLQKGEGDTTLVTSEGVHTDHLSSGNCLARLHMEYETCSKEWNVKKFELALSPVHVQVTLDVVENFAYCYEKFCRGATHRRRKVVKDAFQFYFPNGCGKASGEGVPPPGWLTASGLPRNSIGGVGVLSLNGAMHQNGSLHRKGAAETKRASSRSSICRRFQEEKKKKLKIGSFQVSSVSIHLSFHKETTCSIYQYKNRGPCKLAIRLTYLNDLDDADVTIRPLCLTGVSERHAHHFGSYLLDFYIKELYKGLFFFLTRVNLLNRCISNYYSFFHGLMDTAISSVDVSPGVGRDSGGGGIGRDSGVRGDSCVRGGGSAPRRRHTSLTSACLGGGGQNDPHMHVEAHRGIASDSNFYIKAKKREVLKKLNRHLFYLKSDTQTSVFAENAESNSFAVERACAQTEEKEEEEEEAAPVTPPDNFSLINNTLKTLGKDILSSINYYLYDGDSPGAASPKAASPKAASPKAASPKEASPKAASPKEASPKEASPKEASPKEASHSAANVDLANVGTPPNAALVQAGKPHQADGATTFKTERMHILRHFLENRADPPSGGELAAKADEEFPAYLPLYRRNKLVHDEYVSRVCASVDRRLIRNLVVLDYLHDKQERKLLLFCDDHLVMFHRNTRTVVRKQHIVKLEITCIHFNLTFDRDKSLIMNLRSIIKKNRDNFLGFYFDVLFKRKKKRFLQRIKKKKKKIVYFLYYMFHFIHNYNRKVKLLKGKGGAGGVPPLARKSVNSFVTIFEGHQKVFFSFSSLAHLSRFYLNVRGLLLGMCQPPPSCSG
ncbi:conserved Plasmodium protein, unknown function [Plasmodium vivax]|uniref:Uncharacterized protein n=1 Tax=Plasmodium vivax TaxID=5855 RepID=A0A564ZYT3_PLAVI|nr:conserved Plasmodium protein, unknown function [Plasmodium vivax]